MKALKFILILILLIASAYFLLPKQDINSDGTQNIDDYILAKMEEAAIPGMAVSLIKNNKIVLMKGYGYLNVSKQKEITIDTPFNLASISKPVMGIALLRLVDMGLLDLDEDINAYLPFSIINPNVDDAPITVRHLATHTSSINDYYDIESFTANKDSDTPLIDHIRSLLTPDGTLYDPKIIFKNAPPGTKRDYSNLAAGVAGLVLESISGESLASFSNREIFQTLGMKNTGWRLSEFNLDELATRYNVAQCVPYLNLCADTNSPKSNFLISKIFSPPIEYKKFIEYPHYGNPQYPDGGLNASIHDLTMLIKAILNNGKDTNQTLLSNASFKEMLNLQLPASLSSRQRFFWRDNKAGMTGHTGSDLGVFTSAYFDMKNKTAVIILMNRDVDIYTEQAMEDIRQKLL